MSDTVQDDEEIEESENVIERAGGKLLETVGVTGTDSPGIWETPELLVEGVTRDIVMKGAHAGALGQLYGTTKVGDLDGIEIGKNSEKLPTESK